MNRLSEAGKPVGQSSRKLTRSASFAAAVTLVLFLVAVVPAEFGADPTDLGQVLGLKRMGEIKREFTAISNDADTAPDQHISVTPSGGTRITLDLKPYRGREVKAWMSKGTTIRFDWSSSRDAVEYEFHGDIADAENLAFTSYEKGTRANQSGTFVAGFNGRHGWYWHNLKSKPLIITLTVEGDFEKLAPV
ncbi:MAG: hypothetical protein RLZZ104_550 [Pseudomonadota bacterium]|jgi:hypothetical protein